ncbi:MAG: hypothetical protein V3U84_06695 [Thiotrichaceae bacterium]
MIEDLKLVVVIAIAVIASMFGFGGLLFNLGYEKGQIDYANGNIEYGLVAQPNGEVLWRDIKE